MSDIESFRRSRRAARWTSFVSAGLLALVVAVPAKGGIISLGQAADYGVLGLNGTAIDNSLVTIHGNEGVSSGGSLTNMAPSKVLGTVFEFQSGQASGPGTSTGGIVVDPARMTQSVHDALSASSQAALLRPTQTFGGIGSATTIAGNGGLNVIQINGNIQDSLTLSGKSTDTFIVNVTGTLNYGGSSTLGLAGGVTADHVLYNFVGDCGTITSHVGNVFNGTLLAPNYSFHLDGTFNGEIIGGGCSISLLSGTVVNQIPFVPEPSSILSLSLGALALGGRALWRRRSLAARMRARASGL